MPLDRWNRISKSKPKPKAKTNPNGKRRSKNDPPEELFPDRLEDRGLSRLLLEDLSLRDVVQTMRYIRSHMFQHIAPEQYQSSLMAVPLGHRRYIPPIATLGHIGAVLTSPSKVEREISTLLEKGVVRKVRVESRRGIGEVLIESADYLAMIARESRLSDGAKERFTAFLKSRPRSQSVAGGALPDEVVDELIRTGFLTSSMHRSAAAATSYMPSPSSSSGKDVLRLRPEDRATLTSIAKVSQHASGSVSAVGGPEAIHLMGGSGGGSRTGAHPSSHLFDYRIAIPGHARFMKITEAVVDYLMDLLRKTKWGEGTEAWMRERFESGDLSGRRWKEFGGLEWEWVLGEAVGLGLVEVFETGSVGRGVRALEG